MTPDKDLQFLQFCKNDDLVALCNILTYDDKGGYRINERLTDTDSYLRHYPHEMNQMWKDVAWELQCYGGNTLLNVFARHGRGPAYEEIVSDVCRKLNIKVPRHANCEDMEKLLLEEVVGKALDKMSEAELRLLCDEIGVSYSNKLPKAAIVAALAMTRKTCVRVYCYIIRIIVEFLERVLIGRGVLLATGAVASRAVGFIFGPVGMTIMAGMTIWDIAGPAYRVTIPAVIHVALMRLSYKSEQTEKEVA